MRDRIQRLGTEVPLAGKRMGSIGRQMLALDRVKRAANASKERSGTHAELRHRAARLDQAVSKIIALHQSQDDAGQDHALSTQHQDRIEALRKEAQVTRDFVAGNKPRFNHRGRTKIATQWNLYCMVHNIEKLAKTGYAQ